MCEYCNIRNQNEIFGKKFDLQNTAGFKHDRVYSSWIMKNKADKNAGIMIATNGGNAVYFDIQFCPMCRKEVRKMNEKCLCKKAYEEIDMYYLMSLNEAKGTLQIFKNRGNGNFGMLFTEIPVSYCPKCGRKLGE